MSDPAIEAAQRAWSVWVETDEEGTEGELATAAAREALKPIREKYRELFDQATINFGGADYPFPAGMLHVLLEFAPLIYSSEELEKTQ